VITEAHGIPLAVSLTGGQRNDAVALLVGAVGVANIVVISVHERRSEIGLRRALGATKGHIRIQFLAEATLLALAGGAAGVAAGAAATAIYATANHWAIVIPTTAWAGGLAATLLIGVIAGLMPAIRAARMSPTRALWSVLRRPANVHAITAAGLVISTEQQSAGS